MAVELVWSPKPRNATYRLRFDFSPMLAPGDKLASARAEVVDNGLVVNRITKTDTEMFFWVQGGTPGVANINLIGETAAGETLVEPTKMLVR